ncbi:MAG: thioredoxin domain-containing protein, partial [Terriglobia bacterium]
ENAMSNVPTPEAAPKYTNRLIHETSPYLRQHAHNPVDWHAWGEEALGTARRLDKPILLSIGYSACHWCHVMEKESFENESIAALMNEFFVNIKVDREERPDLDSIYMSYVQLTTGSGGWPMTVFLTPEQIPFFGGTYFPPNDRYGRPGFARICSAVNEAYQTRKTEISASGSEIVAALQKMNKLPEPRDLNGMGILAGAYQQLSTRFDWNHGGFHGAPKFPPAMNLAFCLRYHLRSGQPQAREFVELTLDKMARGGMYDQLGGGFHRYSVDDHWLVPHFEKMLYDNALLSRVYLEAYQLTKKESYRHTVEEILEYVQREMTDAEGGFYSSQDADSEGVEGKYFVWTPEEINSLLGDSLGKQFADFYDVTREGNFEGQNILNRPHTLEECAQRLEIPPEELKANLKDGRTRLLAEREKRVKPGRDDKILSAWNGLMIVGFAQGGRILQRDDFLATARRNAQFLLARTKQGGKLFRVYKDGQAKILGYLEDYANVIEGLITLYEVTGEVEWLEAGKSLTDSLLDQFWDPQESAFSMTGKNHETLITSVKDFYDNATPAGSSVAVLNLLRLSVFYGNLNYREIAEKVLRTMVSALTQSPGGFGYLLQGVDFLLGPVKELAIIGEMDDPRVMNMVGAVYEEFLPNKVLAFSAENQSRTKHDLPLLEGRTLVAGNPATYVCENYVCKTPAVSSGELKKILRG